MDVAGESVLAFPCVPAEGFGAITPDKGIDISKPVSSLKTGEYLGREILCLVKSQKLSSTIKILEPVTDSEVPRTTQPEPKNKKLSFEPGHKRSSLKLFREFYVASQCYSVHFLKTKLALACASGFQIIDPETLDIQALLDPADLSLTFLKPFRDLRPIEIYRADINFLLCYTHCAFYVDKSGWKIESEPVMEWACVSHAFAFHWPYLVIFLPNHVEVRDARDGKPMQIIQGGNPRRLFEYKEPAKRASGTLPREGWPMVMVADSQVMLVKRGSSPFEKESEVDADMPHAL
ncbi:Rho guanine nucleotide exchange factor [Ceratobasidium sp. AG-Ba]|nr:Rho guanine nucleotide exchange factor [Ceratobasidium sp. AG-Ba]QRW03240.1 Rho guanine nucleotide exchange factor [Ceratobasidium sp. AG-Ba]